MLARAVIALVPTPSLRREAGTRRRFWRVLGGRDCERGFVTPFDHAGLCVPPWDRGGLGADVQRGVGIRRVGVHGPGLAFAFPGGASVLAGERGDEGGVDAEAARPLLAKVVGDGREAGFDDAVHDASESVLPLGENLVGQAFLDAAASANPGEAQTASRLPRVQTAGALQLPSSSVLTLGVPSRGVAPAPR
jgi:hypothetical protein